MGILKLEVGAPLTLTVSAIRDVEGKFGLQTAFDTESGDTLFVSKATAERQLERIGGAEPGDTLLFEKVQKDGKTFVNINPAKRSGNGGTGAGAAPKANGNGPTGREQSAPRPVSGLPASRSEVKKALDLDDNVQEALYADCFEAAKRVVLGEFGPNVDPAVVVSAAATLFIQATKRS